MTNTTYYNLNIAEGTDIVNPLTVDNPNYQKIDEVLHDNAVAGVTLATELTNATIHALTRENSDCSVIRFIATSRWKAGDSVTVDGVPVLALLPSGETLPDGAYVINANVLCILTGTNLTVYVGGKKVENASEVIYNDTNVAAELDKINGSVEQLNGSVEQLNGNVAQINNNLQWKLLSTVTGSTLVTLPRTYNELLIKVRGADDERYVNVWYLIPSMLSDIAQQFPLGASRGGEQSTNGSECRIAATSSSVNIQSIYINGTDYASTSVMEVYYR